MGRDRKGVFAIKTAANKVQAAAGNPLAEPFHEALMTAVMSAQATLLQQHERLMRIREAELRREFSNMVSHSMSFPASSPAASSTSLGLCAGAPQRCAPAPAFVPPPMFLPPLSVAPSSPTVPSMPGPALGPWVPQLAEATTQTHEEPLGMLLHEHSQGLHWLHDSLGMHSGVHSDLHLNFRDFDAEAEIKDLCPPQTQEDRTKRLEHFLRSKHAHAESDPDEFSMEQVKAATVRKQLSTKHGRAVLVDQVMGFVICLNTILIGISTDASDSRSWLICDGVFATVFLLEYLYKNCLWGPFEVYFGKDWRWAWFESALIVTAWVEFLLAVKQSSSGGINMSMFRILRLLRITRILRVLRFQIFGDLLMMISGAAGGARTLGWSILLISFPVYTFALVMRETIGNSSNPGEGGNHFKSLPESFFTVFRCLVAGDCSQRDGRPIFVLVAQEHGWFYSVIYMATVTFMTFGLFNVIVAIYVENTVAAAKYNEIYSKRQRLRDAEMLSEKMATLVRLVWGLYDKEGLEAVESFPEKPTARQIAEVAAMIEITPDFLEVLRNHRKFQELLRDLDVSEEDQLDLFETLDVDGGGSIDIEELLLGISRLRGDARRADIIGVGLILRNVQHHIQRFEVAVLEALQEQSTKIVQMKAHPLFRSAPCSGLPASKTPKAPEAPA